MDLELLNNQKFVWDCWENNANKYPDKDAIVFWKSEEEPFRWSYSSLYMTAKAFSYYLINKGIKKGEVCAIIIRHNKYFYPLYMGISLIGAIPAVLAYPNPRLHPDKFRQGIEGMSQRSGLDWIFTEKDLDPIIMPLLEKNENTIKGLHYPLEYDLEGADLTQVENHINELKKGLKSEDPFLLQHSSGTTGLQKPVLLSHKAIIKHVKSYGKSIQLNSNDKVVSWLPLYHDMGLIAAFHIPLAAGVTSIQLDTFEWVLLPHLQLEVISKEKGTLSWLPNFSYNVMADKILDENLENVDLSSWRLSINCSEPVRYESHEKFYNRFKDYGLKKEVLSTCYAMAETTYGVTQTEPGKLPEYVYAERQKLANGKLELLQNENNARICISSGKAIEGTYVKIVDENRYEVEDGIVGEIAITSNAMFDGYRNYPEKTAEVVDKGWYYSGDYGFKYNDNYYVIGRKKDIIIVAGNNIYPEDVEDAISKVEGVIPGRVVAFGEFDDNLGSEQISVAVETNISDPAEEKQLKIRILKAGMAMDISIKKIYLVPPRWLIKSSAGKPSRKANKERLTQIN